MKQNLRYSSSKHRKEKKTARWEKLKQTNSVKTPCNNMSKLVKKNELNKNINDTNAMFEFTRGLKMRQTKRLNRRI